MRTTKDVEAYLLRMGRPFTEVNESTFVVSIEGVPVVVKIAPPLILARCEIGAIPERKATGSELSNREKLYEHLLSLNASTLVHGAYGIEGGKIIIASALELENLDYNELDAILAEIDLALAQHLGGIRELAGQVALAAAAAAATATAKLSK